LSQSPAIALRLCLRSARRLWVVLVAAWAVLTLLTDVFHAGHLLAVRHISCPYDGALIHESEHGTRASAPVKLFLGARASVVPQHEHESCDSLFTSHHPPAITGSSDEWELATVEPTSSNSPHDAPLLGVAVLSYAPKLSPPG
jgi:hypothetical protein